MPEGDTIHRSAAALRRALVGHDLLRVELPRQRPPHPQVGATVTGVEARGKHLLIATSDGLIVHTHQRMTGSWHLYGPGDRWRKSARAARVVLGVPGVTAVCFASPIVEVLDAAAVRRHPVLRRLGPDLCVSEPDLDEVVRRLTHVAEGSRTIGEVLLDQRIASGIGNVYRCEVLFLHGLAPTTPLAQIGDPEKRAVFETAARLLRDNLDTPARSTVAGGAPGAVWVYGRGDEPCRRCGTPIASGHLGEQRRIVYWCPRCQALSPAATGAGAPAPPS